MMKILVLPGQIGLKNRSLRENEFMTNGLLHSMCVALIATVGVKFGPAMIQDQTAVQ